MVTVHIPQSETTPTLIEEDVCTPFSKTVQHLGAKKTRLRDEVGRRLCCRDNSIPIFIQRAFSLCLGSHPVIFGADCVTFFFFFITTTMYVPLCMCFICCGFYLCECLSKLCLALPLRVYRLYRLRRSTRPSAFTSPIFERIVFLSRLSGTECKLSSRRVAPLLLNLMTFLRKNADVARR